jgi:hypothetical protein
LTGAEDLVCWNDTTNFACRDRNEGVRRAKTCRSGEKEKAAHFFTIAAAATCAVSMVVFSLMGALAFGVREAPSIWCRLSFYVAAAARC